MKHPYVQGLVQNFKSNFPRFSESVPSLFDLIPNLGEYRPRALIVAPHPDDEALMSGLALRLKNEMNFQIRVLPMSLGSDPLRRQARSKELDQSLSILGFVRSQEKPDEEGRMSEVQIKEELFMHEPSFIFFPFEKDAHPWHEKTHRMVMDSLTKVAFKGVTFQTEFWGTLPHPNFFVPLTEATVSQMVTATEAHQGEVSRNPFHLFLPHHLIDAARKASETGKPGASSASFLFGQNFLKM